MQWQTNYTVFLNYIHVHGSSWVRILPEAAHFSLKMTTWVCCVVLLCLSKSLGVRVVMYMYEYLYWYRREKRKENPRKKKWYVQLTHVIFMGIFLDCWIYTQAKKFSLLYCSTLLWSLCLYCTNCGAVLCFSVQPFEKVQSDWLLPKSSSFLDQNILLQGRTLHFPGGCRAYNSSSVHVATVVVHY